MKKFLIHPVLEVQVFHGITFSSILDLSRLQEFIEYIHELGISMNFDGQYIDLHSDMYYCPVGSSAYFGAAPRVNDCRLSLAIFADMISDKKARTKYTFTTDYNGFLDHVLVMRYIRDVGGELCRRCKDCHKIPAEVDKAVGKELSDLMTHDVYLVVMQYIHLESDLFEYRLHMMKKYHSTGKLPFLCDKKGTDRRREIPFLSYKIEYNYGTRTRVQKSGH